jgi:cytochrome c-type biogenesis protein CcmH/NrfF
MIDIDWDDPTERSALVERIGVDAYNAALTAHLDRSAIATVSGHRRKDRIERKLCCLVCSGQVPLGDAQEAIARDWRAAYHQYARIKCRRG